MQPIQLSIDIPVDLSTSIKYHTANSIFENFQARHMKSCWYVENSTRKNQKRSKMENVNR